MKSKIIPLLLITFFLVSCVQEQKEETHAVITEELMICTFNIQFLGHFKNRDNSALADLLEDYDIVVVQELVAPPDSGYYPDSTYFKRDTEAYQFINEMENRGFSYILSEEDTGAGEEIHKNSSAIVHCRSYADAQLQILTKL